MNSPMGVGVVGCGSISWIYLQNLNAFTRVRTVACADLDRGRAEWRAGEYGVPAVLETDDLLNHPDVDIVLNLTTPEAHADIALAAVQAGKHVYNEKPLTIEIDDARRLLDEASARSVRVGCAPDTFLGAGIATCRRVLDEGIIGTLVGGTAFFTCPGHEVWHPEPDFYYKRGGGPVLDMGPYYITALVALLGPVRRVTGCTRRTHVQRPILSEPRRGQMMDVDVPTHAAAVLEFTSGPIITLMLSFDVHAARLPIIEIYGSRGTLAVPDPNMFDGPVELFDAETKEWRTHNLIGAYNENSRGLGVAEMADAIASGRPHRASGALALHVLEIMHAVQQASDLGHHIDLTTTCQRPDPLPPDWRA